MTTKSEMIAILKAEYPTLQMGDDEQGYTNLSAANYEAQIAQWADARLDKEAKAEATAQAATDKAALLARLGITADEFKTLLG
jgi:hypothetical protein